ncbi:SDR family oxidoreductase [Ponticoccus alexandrii]|uniref:SDR family NAD(P)-dependent oxidoreductase n=1 Tax=Ponticoccus alexandrii TaxID=1943633 RepID=A0ABX7FE57_9RHOB|nr:SDR family oxidoreductase [Ponticoccus alexandrii]ETA52780.1 epimerase [Rhodobacteraceae bacterium PD-2]QRF67647.1 SDR family NAD(P)-dependent oxidoreductase [Ponticoccus alexandrii]
MTTKTLLSLGHGYSARALAARLLPEGWTVLGTHRDPDRAEGIRATGATPVLWEKEALAGALSRASHLLISPAPTAEGDPSLALLSEEIARRAPHLAWAGYLSTTGVYGDHAGAWVDESAALAPSTRRGEARVKAEAQWRAIPGLPLHIFRLAGIYGPGRGPFEKVRRGTARRIVKPGQVFSRIHVEDIARVLHASIKAPSPGTAYNVCDDDPAPPQDVIAHAAELLGLPLPPEVPFDEAELSPMARSFYAESKRVSNARIKHALGVTLAYPDYRTGLAALLQAEGGN